MVKSNFSVLSINKNARSCELITRAGKVLTPTFMPDGTRGAVKNLTPEQVQSTGVGVVLANTYHLHLQPGEDVIKKLGGLHEFTKQKLPLLTDSGGFQVFSLSKINKITEDGVTFKDPRNGNINFLSPEISMQIQLKLGADMMVAFDDVTALDEQGIQRTTEAFERTHRWLDRSIAEFNRLTKKMKPSERPLLFGVVQGGLDKKLRKKSLELVQATDVDGIAIGGLSVGESRKDMHEMIKFLAPMLGKNRPRFLLGVGDPVDLRYAIEHGFDMLDCVLPTRNARHGTAWVNNPCTCRNKTGKASLSSASRTLSDISSLRGSVEVPKVPLLKASQNKFVNSLECKNCGPQDLKIHITNAKYINDKSVLDIECDCTTCTTGYSKGFLCHQFKVKEPLAGALLSIHNIRYLQRICEEYRA